LQAHDVAMRDFSLDGVRVTDLVHKIWKQVVTAGDTVIDATCGNGHDTAFLAKLVSGEGNQGSVYGFDLQTIAIENTSSFLDKELNANQRERVCLHQMCHSRLGEVIKQKNSVSVVAFNLGYLPGGAKGMITKARTTVEALGCATTLLQLGGVITVVSYVGHAGGREEYEAVRDFSAGLPSDSWISSQQEWLNRPLCPRLFVLVKKDSRTPNI
ncbi:hypothetical protein GOP47_0018102, partial [Adiantum capillus-veneris]